MLKVLDQLLSSVSLHGKFEVKFLSKCFKMVILKNDRKQEL